MKKQKLEINNLKNKIKELENRISEDISTCHKLIYLTTTDFVGSLTNKNLISELKNWCYYDTKTIYPCEYSYDTILNSIKTGKIYPSFVDMLYSKIKNLEEIERTIKKYGGNQE